LPAVAESGSVARASARLRVTAQPGSQLGGLEEVIGSGLLRRLGCGIGMTDIAGHARKLRGRDFQTTRTVRRPACSIARDQMWLANRRCPRETL